MFSLHPTLNKDCFILGDFPLCKLLLMNEQSLPWFILVPKVAELEELYQLNATQQQNFILESSYLSECIQSAYQADKLNIAAIGNMVSQLHIHHIVRYHHDPLWPKPLWSNIKIQTYDKASLFVVIDQLKQSFKNNPKLAFTWEAQWT